MADQDADRSEQATEHKLDEARKKGSVAKSTDLISMGVLAGLAVWLYGNGWDALRHGLRTQQKVLARAGQRDWSTDAMAAWLGELLLDTLSLMGPLFLTLMVVAVLANIAQTGPIFSFFPLKPDLTRINPATGLKKLFNLKVLFEAAKSVIKLAVLGTVLYMLVKDLIPGLVGLSTMDPKGYARLLLAMAGALVLKLVFALLVIALLDMLYTRWDYAKRMRMSKRDVKEESKNREGDPRIRSRIRELRREMLKRSKSLGKVASADVLITNPTRLAVALSYQHGTSGAPKVVAKGAGELARTMREMAAKHAIPIVQNKPLARALFREVDHDGYVPEKLYPQIAKIMVWVYSMREARRASGRTA
jgi:flagellar biosynthetic protein FlhB